MLSVTGNHQVSKSCKGRNFYLFSSGNSPFWMILVEWWRKYLGCNVIILTILQFGNGGSLEHHGFARNKLWTIEKDPPSLPTFDANGKSFIDLLLRPSEEDLKFWPHRYTFECIFIIIIIIISSSSICSWLQLWWTDSSVCHWGQRLEAILGISFTVGQLGYM